MDRNHYISRLGQMNRSLENEPLFNSFRNCLQYGVVRGLLKRAESGRRRLGDNNQLFDGGR
jgi:hypothetical protein